MERRSSVCTWSGGGAILKLVWSGSCGSVSDDGASERKRKKAADGNAYHLKKVCAHARAYTHFFMFFFVLFFSPCQAAMRVN